MADTRPVYIEAARKIVAQISTLETRFPQLAGASQNELSISDTDPGLINWWGKKIASWEHKFGPRITVPNPDYNPNRPFSAVSPTRIGLGPGALEIRVFFVIEEKSIPLYYKERWIIVRFGAMNVYLEVSSFDPQLKAQLDPLFRQLLADEQKAFQTP